MSTWDIKPDGVQGVLSKTAEAGGKFEEEFTAYGEGLAGAATSAGTMVLGGTEIPKGVPSVPWPRRCWSSSSTRRTT
ncbi:DUF6507 family protein [Streptomyces cirratus]|uniref:DUF6507 family protein n=1 Tax=Streptomyces cirratus TaxID=68187 RepID=UPI003605FB4F